MGSTSKSAVPAGSSFSLVDDDLKLFDQALLLGLEWMWADAALVRGLEWFAKQNPLRWQTLAPESCHEWAAVLSSQDSHRPVSTRVPGTSRTERQFESAQAAARWVEDCAQLLDPVIEREILNEREPTSCFPEYWVNNGNTEKFKDAILLPSNQFGPFRELLQATYVPISTRDRPCPSRPPCEHAAKKLKGGCKCARNDGIPGLPKRYEVCQVLRIEDSALWTDYVTRRCQIRQLWSKRGDMTPMMQVAQEPAFTRAITTLEPQAFAPQEEGTSEMYLFHGTNVRSALRIATEKVRLDLSKTEGGLGPGFYLAESVTKADEYATDTARPGDENPDEYYSGVFAMLVIRVTMGKMYPSDHFFRNDGEKTRVMSSILDQREYDSVLGDRRSTAGTFREFCVYDKNQVYTEYVVLYERVYADPLFGLATFAVFQCPVRGAVFNFQVPPYWKNVSKNPSDEPFDEETELRPRGVAFVQRMLRWMGNEDLEVCKATRLEHSDMLQEYLQLKRDIREDLQMKQKVPPPRGKQAWDMVMPRDKMLEFEAEPQVSGSAFSVQNFEQDINEVFLWAPVELTANDKLPSIREAAGKARQSCTLFTSALDALEKRTSANKRSKLLPSNQEQGLLLCRAVCGELAIGRSELLASGADSEVTDLGNGNYCFRLMHPGGRQLYPEIFARLRRP